ncbi:MAG: CrcB family protein [Acetobacter sp.]|nr:CrcB family protein [Acetobacter sp.]
MFAQLMPSLLIGLAGAFGTLLRYWIGLATAHWNGVLPWATMMINITGSFLIVFFGDLTALESKFPLSETMRTIIMVGFFGGYTTFSSFSLQTINQLKDGHPIHALLHIGLTVILCIIGAAAGYMAAEVINSP